MALEMKKIILENLQSDEPNLTPEERNLFVVAYNNTIYDFRKSIGIIRTKKKETIREEELAEKFIDKLMQRIINFVNEFDELLDEILKIDNLPPEDSMYYWKTRGDNFRRINTIDFTNSHINWKEKSTQFYEKSNEFMQLLPSTHVIRLASALSYSTFYYDILGDHEKAITMAKTAFDQAIEKLDDLDEENYKESTFLMQILRDNVQLWTAPESEGPDEDSI